MWTHAAYINGLMHQCIKSSLNSLASIDTAHETKAVVMSAM